MDTPPPEPVIWRCRNRELVLHHRAEVMGILNVTPDSFSDGGHYLTAASAVKRAEAMVDAGAAIIDVGGESTRPGAESVLEADELQRVIPVIESLRRSRPDTLISVDTSKAEVARAAMEAGADIINDVTGACGDPAMWEVARQSGAGLVLMHMQGRPRTMQQNPHYDDLLAELDAFFQERLLAAAAAGIPAAAIALDPGIGFGKTLEHNLLIMRHLKDLYCGGRPLLLGASRKSFLGTLLSLPDPADRDAASALVSARARAQGVLLHRVHDVPGNLAALRLTEALLGQAPESGAA